jgi:hypothetical protein
MGYFLLQECIFDNKTRLNEAVEIVKSNNFEPVAITGHYLEPKNEEIINKINPDLGLVSLNWAKHLGIYDNNAYKVSNYLKYIPEWYINNNCLFLPFWALKVDIFKNEIFRKFSHYSKIFIKPDSGFKTFTGFCIDKADWDKEINLLNVNDNDLIIVSSGEKILNEWRYWIINNEVITYSSYTYDDKEYEEPPEYLINTANLIAKQIKHLKHFTLDLCLTSGFYPHPEVVEINCIYTSGTYNCDLNKLIPKLIKELPQ